MWTGQTKQRRLRKKRVLQSGYIDEDLFKGIYSMLGTDVSFAIPYRPQSKRIERFFDTQDHGFAKRLPTYCGKDTQSRPEGLDKYLKSKTAKCQAYTLESFKAQFALYIDDNYNHQSHTGEGMAGRSPMEVLNTQKTKRVMMLEELDHVLRIWSPELKIGKNGVRFSKVRYGQYSHALRERQGDLVRLSYDPEDASWARVYDAKTWKYIATVEQNAMLAYGTKVSDENLREARKKQARAKRIAKQYIATGRERHMDTVSLAIEAKREETKERREAIEKQPGTPNIQMAKNHLPDQAKAINQEETRKKLKRAVGAESKERDLELNLDELHPQSQKSIKLFDSDIDISRLRDDWK